MTALLQDLRYAVRQLRHAPGFALSVVLVLALGIGANAAMFTVLEATLFRPLPYRHSAELVRLNTVDRQGTPNLPGFPDIQVWQQRAHTLSQITYYDDKAAYIRSQDAEQKVTSVTEIGRAHV